MCPRFSLCPWLSLPRTSEGAVAESYPPGLLPGCASQSWVPTGCGHWQARHLPTILGSEMQSPPGLAHCPRPPVSMVTGHPSLCGVLAYPLLVSLSALYWALRASGTHQRCSLGPRESGAFRCAWGQSRGTWPSAAKTLTPPCPSLSPALWRGFPGCSQQRDLLWANNPWVCDGTDLPHCAGQDTAQRRPASHVAVQEALLLQCVLLAPKLASMQSEWSGQVLGVFGASHLSLE